jgi:hypothetical protein
MKYFTPQLWAVDLHNVVPSQRMVRPEVMAAYRRSNEKYRELYKKLVK